MTTRLVRSFAYIIFTTLMVSSFGYARTVFVDTDASQNPDYTSLSDAITSEASVLSEPLTIVARASSGIPDTSPVKVKGYVTTSEFDIQIELEDGYVLDVTASRQYTYGIEIKSDHVTLRGKGGKIIMRDSGFRAVYGVYSHDQTNSNAYILVENLIVEGINQGGDYHSGILIYGTDAVHVVRNNLVRGFNNLGFYIGNHAYVFNNTSVYNGTGFQLPNGTGEFFNNLSVQNRGDDYYKYQIWNGITTGNNISSDGYGPDSAFHYQSVQFLAPSLADFSLHPDDTSALDRGIDLSAASPPFSTDIDGETRTGAWDIGAYHLDLNTSDSDSDGMPDRWEHLFGLDVLVDDSALDEEGDGLINLEEYALGASPISDDMDGDGVTDQQELANGTSPSINNQARSIIVDTDPAQNPDYTSLAQALESERSILTQPIKFIARASSGIPDTQSFAVSNYLTGPETDITIELEDGYVLEYFATRTYDNAISIAEDFVRLRGKGGKLIVNNDGYTAFRGIYSTPQRPDAIVTLENLRIEQVGARRDGATGIKTYSDQGVHVVRNNVVTGFSGYAMTLYHQSFAYNNTIVNNNYGVSLPYFDGEFINNLVVSNYTNDFYYWQDWSGGVTSHNISSDGTGPDTTGRYQNPRFLDYLIPDYSLRAEDTVAVDQGKDLSAGVFGFNFDKDGATRNGSWEIGAYNVDPATYDLDGDGMADRWETYYGLDTSVNDADLDPDGDGLLNHDEYQISASPLVVDSDADTYTDEQEFQNGTSPYINNLVRTVVVDTDATQNPDYTSLSAAALGEQGVLRQPLKIIARASSGLADTSPVIFEGIHTDDELYINVILEDSYSLDIAATKNHGKAISNSASDLRIRGEGGSIRVNSNGFTGNYGIYSAPNQAGTVVLEQLTVAGDFESGQSGYGIKTYGAQSIHILRNNIVHGFNGTSSSKGMRLYYENYVYNNTVTDNGIGIILSDFSGELYNNLSINNANNDYYQWQVWSGTTSSNNLSGDDTGPNPLHRQKSVAFTNAPANDYSLAESATNVIDQGADLNYDITYPFSADHSGRDRLGLWDIGALEYQSAGSGENRAPVITSAPPATVEVGDTYSYQVTAVDADGDMLVYQVFDEGQGLSIDSQSGLITWIPQSEHVGSNWIDVVVTDGQLEDYQKYTLTVTQANNASPTISSSPITSGAESQLYSYAVIATDPEEQSLIYSLVSGPNGMTMDPNSGVLSWLPGANSAGSYAIEIEVFDPEGLSDSQNYTLTIANTNEAPIALNQSQELAEDTSINLTLTGSDPDGDALSYTIVTQPSNGTLSGTAPNVSYQPNANFNGADSFTFKANDGGADSGIATVSLTINAVNDAPQITSTPVTEGQEGQAYGYQVAAIDVDGDTVSYALTGAPIGMSINAETGAIAWLPDYEAADSYPIGVTVSDGALTSHQNFELIVSNTNRPPQITSIPMMEVVEQNQYSYLIDAHDEDGDLLSFYLVNGPENAALDASTGVLTWFPLASYVQPVSENNLSCYVDSISVGLSASELPGERINLPDLSLSNIEVSQTSTNQYRVSVVLSNRGLSDINSPVNVRFYKNSKTLDNIIGEIEVAGVLSGTAVRPEIEYESLTIEDDIYAEVVVENSINECTVENNSISAALLEVTVEDGQGASSRQLFALNVLDANSSPFIDIADEYESTEGNLINIDIDATDPDIGDGLSYRIVDGSEGLHINSRTGRLWADPGTLLEGTYNIRVEVSDLRGAVSQASFSLNVNSNQAPNIISVPNSGTEGQIYNYQINASDPDPEDSLSFSAQTREGLSINGYTGLLTIETSDYIGNLGGQNRFCKANPIPERGTFTPRTKWHWLAPLGDPGYQLRTVMSTPVVVPLYDTNMDGAINVEDDSAVVFISGDDSGGGLLRAIWAKNGAHIWTVGNAEWRTAYASSLSAADIDGDGEIEILAISKDNYDLMAFSHEGELEWRRDVEWQYFPDEHLAFWGGVSIADLEGDGIVDILAGNSVFYGDGTPRWNRNGSTGCNGCSTGPISFAVDLDLDGYQEVIAGGAAYTYDGQIVFDNGEGFSAVGNFDDDDFPEIVVVRSQNVYLYEHDGSPKWDQPFTLPGSGSKNYGGAPVVADMDGDGYPEIGVAGARYYVAINRFGQRLWRKTVSDTSSGRTGSTVFDFEGDGKAEVLYSDEHYFRIYDGATGYVKYELPNASSTGHEYPVVVDVDHDNHAEIVLVSSRPSTDSNGYRVYAGIRVIEDSDDSWIATRTIWNQYAYHIDNISDDLSIPPSPEKSWLRHNSFRLNTFPEYDPLALSDLSVESIHFDTNANLLRATVINRGLKPTHGNSEVIFTHILPDQSEIELGRIVAGPIDVMDLLDVELSLAQTPVSGDIRVDIASDANDPECLDDNNSLTVASINLTVSDNAGLTDTQSFLLKFDPINHRPVVSSSLALQISEGADLSHQVEISDESRGDDHLFRLIQASPGIEIGKYSGSIKASNLSSGSYEFLVEVEDLQGNTTIAPHVLAVNLPNNTPPEITSEAPREAIVGLEYAYTLQAADPEGDDLTFVVSRPQPGLSIDSETGAVSWVPQESGIKNIEFTVFDSSGALVREYVVVNVVENSATNHFPQIISEPDGAVYEGQWYQYDVIASDADNDTLSYEVSPSDKHLSISSDGVLRWLPDASEIGKTVELEIRVSDGKGGSDTQKLYLAVNEWINRAPRIISFPQTIVGLGQTYAYTVVSQDLDGDDVVTSIETAPNGMSLIEEQLVWTPSVKQVNKSHSVSVKVEDSRGAVALQTFSVSVLAAIENGSAPVIESLPPTLAIIGQPYSYDVRVRDIQERVLAFNLGAHPSGMTINSNGTVQWTPMENHIGIHEIILNVSDGHKVTQQQYLLEVSEPQDISEYPEISSTPFGIAVVDASYVYSIQATDPDGDELSYGAITLPESVTVSVDGVLNWTPTSEQIGTHHITVYADDGTLRTLQSFTVNVVSEAAPLSTEILLSPGNVGAGETLEINVYVEGGVTEPTINLTHDSNPIELDQYGYAEITSAEFGVHQIIATVTAGNETVTESVTYSVIDPSDTEAPWVSIASPDYDSVINAPIDIIGSVSDSNLAFYRVLLSPRGEQNWITLSESFLSVSDDVLGALDPTLLLNGQYDLAIYAEDTNGQSSSASVVISVDGDLKVGNFSVTFQDLSVPLAGMPIEVSRTYDSRQKLDELDFGYGWNLSVNNIKLEESRAPGAGWSLNEYQRGLYGLILDLCVEPLGAPIITVTLPDGDVERFEVSASPSCSTYTAILDVALEFVPIGDTQSQLIALEHSEARYVDGNLVDRDQFSMPVNPNRYLLTTQAGYKYYINQNTGLEKVVDPNGHTLTYTENGIFHSAGKSVTFTRDSLDRITSVEDPAGNTYLYQYDENGDLVAFEDPLANNTEYGYNSNHGLTDIHDPLGRPVVRNIYDDDGRLIAQEDGEGNRTEFNHDIDGRQSVIMDRRNNITVYYFDDQGNVTSEVNALNEVTTYSYDDRGNQLSKTDALGNTESAIYDERNNQLTQTDALGNTVSFSYNQRGQELTIEDARGNVYENQYDSVGNLLSVSDPQGNVASNLINAQGLVDSTQDAEGNVTSYTYYPDGSKESEMDPEGNVTFFTYDANGNVLTESRTRTLADSATVTDLTRYEYDALNRLTKTIYPNGSESTIEYDAAGNERATVDQKGNRTEYDYDAYGRLLTTAYADGSTSSSTYDAEGNKLTDTDRNGHTTSYSYDALNRLVRTTHPDNSYSETEYDAAGRVTAEIDANGNRTEYSYDAAGRRIAVQNSLFKVHTFDYDADGNLIAETDAGLNTVSYTLNGLDQKTQTTFPDTSTIQQGFDRLGRRTSQIDQDSKITQYAYDGLGRLTSVTDALLQETSYTYDEAGNKLSQTDAEGRTTTWTYDGLGRVLSRTLPEGQVESFTYDDAGNMTTHTDFKGQMKSYSYDLNHRVTRIDYHDGLVETFSYDNVGNRTSATSAEGTTTYTYDNRNRLILEQQPNGATLTYEYDNFGNKTQLTITIGSDVREESYTYDSLNRLETVIDADGGVTSYSYDAVGNRTSVSYPNGSSITYTYDSLNRLTQVTHYSGSGALVQQFDYTLHSTGRRTLVDELSGRQTQYTYDDLYRLTDETITDTINGGYTASYQYDNVGNRTYSTIDGVSKAYTYDNNDRLTQQGGTTYSYDANGNTETESDGVTTTTYTYDAKNKLIQVDRDGDIATYSYNIDGVRTAQMTDGTETQYVVDTNRSYAQVITEMDAANAIQVEYTYGDDLISQERAGTDFYYLYDGLGSTRSLTNSTGVVTDTYNYEAFGELLNHTGSTKNNYLYTGEQFDANLDQYYLRARYYDQGVGRFTQMDTWMGRNHDPITLNKYAYAYSDPVTYTDPTGNFGTLSGFGASNTMMGVLATASIASYGIGQSLAGGGSYDGVFTSSQLGWLVLAGMAGQGSSLYDLISSKVSAREDSDITVDLSRVVEDGELASMYSCKCYSLGRNGFPKQFFHTDAEAIAFGDDFIKRRMREPRYHLTQATISRRLYNTLDHDAYEPGIGPIVTVPNGLLPAFNLEVDRNGGWRYQGTY